MAQEVSISFQEEIALDIAPCETGSLDCLPSVPIVINDRMLRSGSGEEIIPSESSHGIQTLYFFSTEENFMNGMIDVEVSIHLGLNDRRREVQVSQLNDDTLTRLTMVHEYVSLDVDPVLPGGGCLQGFQTLWDKTQLIELTVCPNRLGYIEAFEAMKSNSSLGSMLTSKYEGYSPFATYILQDTSNMPLVGGGYQHILIDQEYLLAIPCAPGMFCSHDGGGLFLMPHVCPLGTYNSMVGQKRESDCIPCPLGFTTETSGSWSLDQCHGDSISESSNSTNTTTVESYTYFSSVLMGPQISTNEINISVVDAVESQYTLKQEITQWLSEASDDTNPAMIYILKWDI